MASCQLQSSNMLEFVEVLVAVQGEENQSPFIQQGEFQQAALIHHGDLQQHAVVQKGELQDVIEEEQLAPAKKERKPRVCIKGYVEEVVRQYSDEEFRTQFRMDRKRARKLVTLFANSEWGPKPAPHGGGREIISPEKQILSYLWYVGHRAPNYRDVVERFDLSKDTLSKIFAKVNKFLFSLSKDVIRWPSRADLRNISEGFKANCGLPNVYGCVGITHVRIEKPIENAEAYKNKKQYYSIQVQAICDDRGRFLDVFLGSGCVQNVRTMKNFFIYPTLPQQCEGGYIVGDSSYALKTWCLVPYPDDGNLTDLQNDFNFKLNSARMEIKHAFVKLKDRFPIVRYIPFRRIDLINDMIMGCFVLYNWDFKMNEFGDLPDVDEHNYNRPSSNDISSDDDGDDMPNEENRAPPREAVTLRETITEQLAQQPNVNIDETILALSALTSEKEEAANLMSDKSMPDSAIRLLISTYCQYFKVQKPGTKKHQLWQRVGAVFQAKGYAYTVKQLINKWHTLERGFKKYTTNFKQFKGRGVTPCSYLRELEEVVAECPNIFKNLEYMPGQIKRQSDALNDGVQIWQDTVKRNRLADVDDSSSDESEDYEDYSNNPSSPVAKNIAVPLIDSNSISQELLVQELAEFRKTFQAYTEKKALQRQLRHAEKMQLLRDIMGLPSPSRVKSHGRPKRGKK